MTCSWLVHYLFMTFSLLFQNLFITSLLGHKFFITCSGLVHDLFMTILKLFHLLTTFEILLVDELFTFYSKFFPDLFPTFSWLAHSFEFLHLHFFSRLWLTSLTQLPFNYFNLFPSLEVLCFSHLPRSKFTKRNKLNRLVGLSLAQLSPSLFSNLILFLQSFQME